jgi:glycosyltransferase involved in cell wall biosynthesis
MAKGDERIITHISNFRKVKRIPDVIKYFIKFNRNPAKLMMVGDGPEKKAEYLCQELGITDKVIFWKQ